MTGERVARNTVAQFVSRNIGKLSKLVGSVLLANIAGAGALGVFYVFMSVFRIGKRATSLGLGQSVVKRVSEGQVDRRHSADSEILASALSLRLTAILLIGILAVLFRSRIDSYVGLERGWALFLIVVGLSGTYTLFRAVLAGRHRLDLTGYLGTLRDVTTVVAQVTLVAVGWSAGGIVVGLAFGLFVTLVSAVTLVRPPLSVDVSREQIRSIVEFSKFSYLDSMVGGEQRWVDVLVLGAFVAKADIGVYGIAYTAAHFGIVFTTSLSSSIFPEVSSASEDDGESSEQIVEKGLRYTALFSLPLAFGTVAVGDLILRVVYDFATGYTVFVTLAVGFVFSSLTGPIHQTLYGLDTPSLAFYTGLSATVVNVLLAVVLVPRYGIVGAASSTSTALAVGFGVAVYLYTTVADADVRMPYGAWGRQCASASLMLVTVVGLRGLVNSHSLVTVSLLILAGGGIYFTALLAVDGRFRTHAWRLWEMAV